MYKYGFFTASPKNASEAVAKFDDHDLNLAFTVKKPTGCHELALNFHPRLGPRTVRHWERHLTLPISSQVGPRCAQCWGSALNDGGWPTEKYAVLTSNDAEPVRTSSTRLELREGHIQALDEELCKTEETGVSTKVQGVKIDIRSILAVSTLTLEP